MANGQSRYVLMVLIFIYLSWSSFRIWHLTTSPVTDQSHCHLQLRLLEQLPIWSHCFLPDLLLYIFKTAAKTSSQLESYHVFLCLKPSNGSHRNIVKAKVLSMVLKQPYITWLFFGSLTSLPTFLPLLCTCQSTFYREVTLTQLFTVCFSLLKNRLF